MAALVLAGAGCEAGARPAETTPSATTAAVEATEAPPAAPDPRGIVLGTDDVPAGLSLVDRESGSLAAGDRFQGVRLPLGLRDAFEAGHRTTFEPRPGASPDVTYVASVALVFDGPRAATLALRAARRSRLARVAGAISIQGEPLGREATAWVLEDPVERERVVALAWRRGRVALGVVVERRGGNLGVVEALRLARVVDERVPA